MLQASASPMDKEKVVSGKRVFLGGLLTVAICIILLLLLSLQMRNFLLYRVAPKIARNHNFIRLEHPEHGEVLLLGTTHMRHFSSKVFGLQHLEAVLENTKAIYVFVEMQQEEVQRKFYGDGPVEMPFIALRALELGQKVLGFDWWLEKKSDASRTGKKRGEHMFDRLRLSLPHQGRSLVFLGYAQVDELKKRLLGMGFTEKSFSDDEKDAFFAFTPRALVFPLGMKKVVQERISLLQKRAAASQSLKWRNDLQRVIDRRTELLHYVELKGERAKSASKATTKKQLENRPDDTEKSPTEKMP